MFNYCIKFCAMLLFLAILGWGEIPSSGTVQLGNPVYDFVERIVTRYAIDFQGVNSKPYTRSQIAMFISDIEACTKKNKSCRLSIVEKQELAYYKKEFSFDLAELDPTVRYDEKHIFFYNRTASGNKDDFLKIDLGFRDSAGYVSASGEEFISGCFYGGIYGSIHGILVQNEIQVASELNSENKYFSHDYNPIHGYPYNVFGNQDSTNKKSWDTFTSGIFFRKNRFLLSLAVDRMRWGPGEFVQLALSGNTPPMGTLKAETDFWRFHYIHTINMLKGYKYQKKYLYAHRLECVLPKKVTVGVNEMVVYGDNTNDGDTLHPGTTFQTRNFDLIYSIPFIPYYFAQHYSGDRDNMALSFDVTSTTIRNLKLYIELFLDDLISPVSFFDDWWSNKWAFTSGGRFIIPVLYPDMDICVEYTRIEPWVYTHFFGESHRYTHYGESLGANFGPNADALTISLGIRPSQKLNSHVLFQHSRKGQGNPGDAITDIHYLIPPAGLTAEKYNTKYFLGKNYQSTSIIGIDFSLRATRLLNIRLYGTQELTNNNERSALAVIDIYW
ncbi:MAG: hypothetical protein A2519_15015 [Candidatus Raymondbacteria bacterium RIFOXYD12_FULL_49_13]|uniref:Capsule assembly Wzi family protein n=1 Tax=Candidatus Raymondbacteria bacterium RIFOXYD12_FULL_49_13 TaxID=1817890 RepID=A0A1F7F4F0_UNCRA|nr:MAG: hypothetical protein A2519_15015 [Candidatus Raymondbacteria bacterium RIFOXYD12_FULL_49_13]